MDPVTIHGRIGNHGCVHTVTNQLNTDDHRRLAHRGIHGLNFHHKNGIVHIFDSLMDADDVQLYDNWILKWFDTVWLDDCCYGLQCQQWGFLWSDYCLFHLTNSTMPSTDWPAQIVLHRLLCQTDHRHRKYPSEPNAVHQRMLEPPIAVEPIHFPLYCRSSEWFDWFRSAVLHHCKSFPHKVDMFRLFQRWWSLQRAPNIHGMAVVVVVHSMAFHSVCMVADRIYMVYCIVCMVFHKMNMVCHMMSMVFPQSLHNGIPNNLSIHILNDKIEITVGSKKSSQIIDYFLQEKRVQSNLEPVQRSDDR